MSEKITIKIIVFNHSVPLRSINFSNVITFIQTQRNAIPPGYQSTAKWSMDTSPIGDDVNLVISYKRLETDEENTARDEAQAIADDEMFQERVAKAVLIAEKYPGILMINPDVLGE